MTSLLPMPTIRLLTDALVDAGLATPDARAELLQGIHAGFVASLPLAGNLLDQVRSDLATMNQVPALADGQLPLQVWLTNAVGRLKRRGRVEATTFQSALDELAAARSRPQPVTALSGTAQPAAAPPLSPDEVQSLQRQLADLKENLRLINERKAQFVEETEIPLQLVRNEKKLRERIAEVERKLGSANEA